MPSIPSPVSPQKQHHYCYHYHHNHYHGQIITLKTEKTLLPSRFFVHHVKNTAPGCFQQLDIFFDLRFLPVRASFVSQHLLSAFHSILILRFYRLNHLYTFLVQIYSTIYNLDRFNHYNRNLINQQTSHS